MGVPLFGGGASLLTTRTIANQVRQINHPYRRCNCFIVGQKVKQRSNCGFEENTFEDRRPKSPIKVGNRRYKEVSFAHVAHFVPRSFYLHERQVEVLQTFPSKPRIQKDDLSSGLHFLVLSIPPGFHAYETLEIKSSSEFSSRSIFPLS